MSAPNQYTWKSLADLDWEIKRHEQEIAKLEQQRRKMVERFSTASEQ